MTALSVKGGLKRCCDCCADKAVTEFGSYAYTTNQGKRSTRIDSRCRACNRARRKAAYAVDGERMRAVGRAYKARRGQALLDQVQAYRAANREKWLLQKRGYEQRRRSCAALDSVDAVALVARVLDEARVGRKWLDAYSGELISDPEVDHIVPLSKGGRHEYENLCVTSGWNNRSKSNRPVLAWMAQRRRAA